MLAGMMTLTMLTCALAITGAAALGAQTSTETTTTTTTKIDLTGGKHVKVTGCVEPGPDGGFVLTNVFDKNGPHRYMLVSSNDFFAKHAGNRVQVEGRAADGRHGWAAIESETKTDGVSTAHVNTDARNGSSLRYLGVDHMKMIATSCP